MNTTLRAAAIAAAIAAVAANPASAANLIYDAFSSFNATQGAGNFTYGAFDGISTFTPFTTPSGCTDLIANTICLNDGFLPGVFKTTAGAGVSGSVIVPADALIMHPGAGNDAAYVEFTGTVAGSYTLDASFSVQDSNPSGVEILFFYRSGGVLQALFPLSPLNSGFPGFSVFLGGYLPTGDSVGFIVDKQGAYSNDSTGVTFTMTRVPEPASWAMLLAGFGLTGAALRRRRAVAPTA